MNTEEILLKILEEQKSMRSEISLIRDEQKSMKSEISLIRDEQKSMKSEISLIRDEQKRMAKEQEKITVRLDEIAEDARVTRTALNHNSECLELLTKELREQNIVNVRY